MTPNKFMIRLAAVALPAISPPAGLSDGPRPNILFILMDDMGWRDAGCYGSDYYETPNIDRLAREGVRFTEAYVDAPVCTPSRACLISGQRGPRHGIYIVSPEPDKAAEWQRYQAAMAAKPMVRWQTIRPFPHRSSGCLPRSNAPATRQVSRASGTTNRTRQRWVSTSTCGRREPKTIRRTSAN